MNWGMRKKRKINGFSRILASQFGSTMQLINSILSHRTEFVSPCDQLLLSKSMKWSINRSTKNVRSVTSFSPTNADSDSNSKNDHLDVLKCHYHGQRITLWDWTLSDGNKALSWAIWHRRSLQSGRIGDCLENKIFSSSRLFVICCWKSEKGSHFEILWG
jgi:hypothetical protein